MFMNIKMLSNGLDKLINGLSDFLNALFGTNPALQYKPVPIKRPRQPQSRKPRY
jgi:hypothetical protein